MRAVVVINHGRDGKKLIAWGLGKVGLLDYSSPQVYPGEAWIVRVVLSAERYFVVLPIERLEPRVASPREVLRRYEFRGMIFRTERILCGICQSADGAMSVYDRKERKGLIVCPVCDERMREDNPILHPPMGSDYGVVEHYFRRNLRNTFGGDPWGLQRGVNLRAFAYVYGDTACTEPLSLKAHGRQHEVYEVVCIEGTSAAERRRAQEAAGYEFGRLLPEEEEIRRRVLERAKQIAVSRAENSYGGMIDRYTRENPEEIERLRRLVRDAEAEDLWPILFGELVWLRHLSDSELAEILREKVKQQRRKIEETAYYTVDPEEIERISHEVYANWDAKLGLPPTRILVKKA